MRTGIISLLLVIFSIGILASANADYVLQEKNGTGKILVTDSDFHKNRGYLLKNYKIVRNKGVSREDEIKKFKKEHDEATAKQNQKFKDEAAGLPV